MPREKERILLQHGDGGQLTHRLIREVFLKAFPDPGLAELTDAALLPAPRGRLAVTTDSFTVQPAFFPGGDLGEL
ncbi:MAG: hydrogenase expression/formation protein HypE, partial [Firmicutes bacterium]|nr:hydrogenase expression/formation protein HypE [Bacillota bacterium]